MIQNPTPTQLKNLKQRLGMEYVQGATLRDLANKYGIGYNTVRKYLKQTGVRIRPPIRKGRGKKRTFEEIVRCRRCDKKVTHLDSVKQQLCGVCYYAKMPRKLERTSTNMFLQEMRKLPKPITIPEAHKIMKQKGYQEAYRTFSRKIKELTAERKIASRVENAPSGGRRRIIYKVAG